MNELADDVTEALPVGTVTFLFTDIEGSTKLLGQLGDEYAIVLADQRRILRAILTKWHGSEVDTQGDSFFVSFPRATEAIAAAVEIQHSLAEHEWPQDVHVRVRMGLHTGEPLAAEEGYVGMDVHRAARIAHVAHGNQVLLSETSAALVRDDLPDGTSLLDLGRHRLKDIERPEHIRQLVIEGLPSEHPPLKTLETVAAESRTVPQNLPVQSTPFVGREKELADLEKLLGDSDIRLVTVVGPGGMGKTRLALAAAERQLEIQPELSDNGGPRYPNGAFFVALDGLDNPAQIVPEMARSLGLSLVSLGESGGGMGGPEPAAEEQLLDYLSNKQLLLVVDNFEHLLEGAGLIAEIVKRAPEAQILLTSREKLGLHGEQLYQLKGMRVPLKEFEASSAEEMLAGYSSSRLFIQSARRQTSDFALQPGEIPTMAQICRLVEGMPLALEMAAGWVDVLSLGDIAAEIQDGIALLETDTLNVPDRHRSIEAVFRLTWRRLEPAEQEVFTQLCVFHGGFTRQAAREITGASLRQLAGLMNKSLLLFDRQANRYTIHRLLRQYGLTRLAKVPTTDQAIRDMHCSFYSSKMKHWGVSLKGKGQRQALIEMEVESQNILAAWERAVSQKQVDLLIESIESLMRFYILSGRVSQWEEVCISAVDRLKAEAGLVAKHVQAKLLIRQGWFQDTDKELTSVKNGLDLITQLDLAGHEIKSDKAFALWKIGSLKIAQGDGVKGNQLLSQSQDIYESLGDTAGLAMVLSTKGLLALRRGEFEQADLHLNKCYELWGHLGDRFAELYALRNLSFLARTKGEIEKARTIDEKVILIYKEDDNQVDLIDALDNYGWTLFTIGNFIESRSAFIERDAICEDLGLGYSGIGKAMCAIYSGEYETADVFRNAEVYVEERLGYSTATISRLLGLAAIGRQEYIEARNFIEQAIAVNREHQKWVGLAVDLAWLSVVLHLLNSNVVSNLKLRKSLEITLSTRNTSLLWLPLVAAALGLANNGKSEQAIEIYALAHTSPYVANAKIFEDVVGKKIALIAGSLPPEAAEAARQRGRERDPRETVKEILAELESDQEEESA